MRRTVEDENPKLMKESHIQIAVCNWCRNNLKRTDFFGQTNGATLASPAHAMALKAQGMSNGVPDMHFPIVTGQFLGMVIELKRMGAEVLFPSLNHRPEQYEWLTHYGNIGHLAVSIKGHIAAIDIISRYVNGEDLPEANKEIRYYGNGCTGVEGEHPPVQITEVLLLKRIQSKRDATGAGNLSDDYGQLREW